MKVGSLFSGIGGIDLGLERAGMTVVWQAENDPYCARVLKKHWPTVPNLGDVTAIDWKDVERVDLICGGYPCQPFSVAGRRSGTDDARHLWPYFRDALSVLRPRLALLENVPGHLSLGFGDVLADLAALGYDTEWDCISAASVGAPHIRDRLFVVAYAGGDVVRDESGWRDGEGRSGPAVARDDGTPESVADPEVDGREQRVSGRLAWDSGGMPQGRGGAVADTDRASRGTAGTASETVHGPSPVERPRRRGGSLGDQWAVEPDVGRVANGIPHRMDRLRGLGNAVVPQVAELVGTRIMEAR